MPGPQGRHDDPIGASEHVEHVSFERFPIALGPGAGTQFLGDNGAEELERCERAMEFLKRLVRGRLPESLDEELGVEKRTSVRETALFSGLAK